MPRNRELIIATVKENVSLSAFDTETGERIAAVTVGEKDVAKPHEITLSKDGSRAFVSIYGDKDYGRNTPDNRIAVVDLKAMELLGHINLDLYRGPHAMMTDAEGKIWVTVEENRCALVIDPDSREIERTIFLEVPGHFLAPAPDGATVYFSAKEYPVICEVDVAAKTVRARIGLPVGAQAIRVSPDGSKLYVGDFYRPLLHVVDCASRQLIETVPLKGVPGWPFNSPEGDLVIMTTYDEPADRGYVELLDSGDLTERRVIDVPAEPFHAAPMRDGEHILVALANGEFVKINLREGAIVPGGFGAGGVMPETVLPLPE
jgi:DNA-binding beta-propeller fold protein YncE